MKATNILLLSNSGEFAGGGEHSLAAVAYYGVILSRFRFARGYPSHRRAWWLVPVVKLTMDLGTEVGRWKTLLLRQR